MNDKQSFAIVACGKLKTNKLLDAGIVCFQLCAVKLVYQNVVLLR